MTRDVQEIDADGEAELVERVAAIDVAKASGMVCTRVPHASVAGRRVTRVWEVRSTTNAILALACDQRLEHRAAGDAEDVRGDGGELDQGVLEQLLEPLRVPGALLGQVEAQARVVA